MLLLGEHNTCYDAHFHTVVGLGWLPKTELDQYGWTSEWMRSNAFALHFSGTAKPWQPNAKGPFDSMWSEYSSAWSE